MLSGVVAGLDTEPDLAVVRLSGELRMGTLPDVRRVLGKLLATHGRVLVDLSRFRVAWRPALQVFPSVFADAGGWPSVHLVLFGADPAMHHELHALRVPESVPLVADEATAQRRLEYRPDHVSRRRDLPADAHAPRAARAFVREACADWNVPDVADEAALVVTELVSNAVEHAGTSASV
ncbi:MAG TPA: hypothetical protein VD813_12750, partial [Pseudonocardia sp.]|nr:hypothetical protein [Pseudonocardia sp.]